MPQAVKQHSTHTPTKPSRLHPPSGFRSAPPLASVSATGSLSPADSDAALITACADYPARAGEVNHELAEKEDGPIWQRYSACRDTITATPATTIAGLLAKARAIKIEAQRPDGTETLSDTMGVPWAMDLVNDLLWLFRGIGSPHGTENPSSAGTLHGGEYPVSANRSQMEAPSAASGELPQIACPALALGAELSRVITAYQTSDEAVLAAYQAKQWADHNRSQARLELLEERREHLEQAATFTSATTLQGALVQVLLAGAVADQLVTFSLSADQAEEQGKKLMRLLHSVRGALETVTSDDGIEALGEFYMRGDSNPFLALEVGV